MFAPACVSHTVLTKKDWKDIKIDSVSLPSALHCWQMDTRFTKFNKVKPSRVNNSGHQINRRITKVDKQTAENALKRKQKQKVRRNGQRPKGNVPINIYIFFFSDFCIFRNLKNRPFTSIVDNKILYIYP